MHRLGIIGGVAIMLGGGDHPGHQGDHPDHPGR